MARSPEISLSFKRIAIAQCGATLFAGVLWFSGALLFKFDLQVALSGVASAGVLLVVSLIILTLFSPQKQRPIATVATLWAATSFLRFIVALGGASLLYYMAQFGLRPLMFSFLFTAVFLLLAETKSISNMHADYCNSTTK